ncbi:ABC transporter permease [Salinibacterium sp. ZJ454]|uniref:ABC transporter permease n=1 Tax=Salinibacterium sp. ZJ454 TaxID=2708339 RepID=UPI001FB986D0|nr:ABC transporter permease [Salinibacterium sp. ZJ454]
MRIFRAELAKLFSTRMWWILLAALVVYVAFVAVLFAVLFGALSDQLNTGAGAPVELDDAFRLVYSSATTIGYVFPVLLGALAVTAEFRHQTLTPTFLATPRRGRVLAGKIAALGVVGALFGVAGFIASVAPGALVLGLTDMNTGLSDSDTWVMIVRGILAMALWAIIGVGLGALIPNQVAVIVIVLVFTQFIEPILRTAAGIWEWAGAVAQYLPGAASDALVGASVFSSLATTGAVPVLEWWQGGLVLLAIAVVATAAGYLTSWKKDVT